MKTIPKRPDLFTNPTDNNEKQMSQLLQMKNMLHSKLAILTKTISQDFFSFTTKNYPHEVKDINLINAQKNLFGTKRSFCQFSIDFKGLMLKFQSEVKGVIQVMEKYSFTKNISIFINNGIMDSFLKINDLMLRRQQFCNKLMQKIQQSVMNGNTIFSKHFNSNNLCMKCNSALQKDKVISTKQAILLGGPKISNLYHKQLLIADEQDDDSHSENDFYNKITNARRNVKEIQGTDPHQIKSQQDIRYNLERLQNNIEQRKYDILACLMEMGQFGSTLVKSSEMIENSIKQNSLAKQITKFASLLPSIQKLPPKFNFKQFTFDVSKYFFKEIKDIQVQLSGIKTKYKTLISTQFQQQLSKEVQCDIAKDQHEKQMEKYKKKTQRQIKNLNQRITQIEGLNKGYKSKINEYENAVKSQINSKLQKDNKQIQNITVQKRISRLIDQYESKIKMQQQELKSFRESKLNSQSMLSSVKLNQQKLQASCTELIKQGSPPKQVPNAINKKIHSLVKIDKNKNIEMRQKISLFLQPIVKRLSKNSINDVENKISQNQQISINKNAQKILSLQQIIKFIQDNTQQKQSLQKQIYRERKLQSNLKINSNVFELNVIVSKFSHAQFNIHRSSSRPHQRRQSQVIHPREIQILTDKDSNKILSHFNNQRQIAPKIKLLKSPKLTKVKSQENTKFQKMDKSYEEKQIFKQGKKLQHNNEQIKRYSSEHSGNIIDKKVAFLINKNPKQKASKKALKALSLTILKKGQQEQPKSSTKLPSLSQYQKSIHKLDKIKQLQKVPQINSKTNLLMKKKRKKRHFSQQALTMDSLFSNHEMTMSLGSNIQKQIKQKTKKQYIIDFIPKIDQSNVSKFKQDQKKVIEDHIQGLFDIKQTKKSQLQHKKTNKKGKYFTKTILTKDNDDYHSMQKLKKQEIQLSTKIYSLMATIKSADYATYNSIRQKLRQQYEKNQRIKTNCDHISMTMDLADNSVSHLPLSLSLNPVQMEGCESSFEIKKQIYQVISTNQNENQGDKIKQNIDVKPDYKQLNKIINFLIVKHRNLCIDIQNKQDANKKTGTKICFHLMSFYQSLVSFAGKSPSQPSTIQRN